MILKDLKNNERGSITVLVLATMLLVTGIIFISYFSMMNKSSSQASQIEKIQEEYNQSNTMMSQAYDDAKANQYQTISILKEGDWVYYEDATGTIRKCVVLWDESSGYGTQIITMETVEDVEIGNGTGTSITFQSPNDQYFIKALDSYNNAISMLNGKAMDYKNEDYAIDARCVGSVPNDKNSEGSGYYTHTNSWFSLYDNRFKNGDENYRIDFEQMEKIGGIIVINKSYWFASRIVDAMSAAVYPDIYMSSSTILNGIANIFQLNSSTKKSLSVTSGLRPVFTLKDEVKVTGGSGTEDDPYTLGV